MSQFEINAYDDTADAVRVVDRYSELSSAVEAVERETTDDHLGWSFTSTSLRLVDAVRADDAVTVYVITPVGTDEGG
ncbi:hypothetical protein [Candidatus Halobonum tyrrellensis]|uniref:Uncharacterized protein n=1 Tax=Candidatus Halobonum tyrrellensis G22 TaxID=1324957 RepID=V4GQL6_9EURY|nr:hypothetical protein [Candidatus Halobonum tyrrellensis]ESP87316.1 hypothetical protein K933_14558 [Candidatus Halobonum tyrrellensis G22]